VYNLQAMNDSVFRGLPRGARVLVAMSGGVDSTVAAHRLVKAGFDVTGITMHLVSPDQKPVKGTQASDDRACCSITAAEDARRMANELEIPHYMLNLAEMFEEKVMLPSRIEYMLGRTPNPCVLCNRYMKFDILFKRADQLDCPYVATGHYARITEDEEGVTRLFRGADPSKDQSYFLSYLTGVELGQIIFPLGDDVKQSIRDEAAELGLKVADRPDSQDLCFIASGGIGPGPSDEETETISGDIVMTDGKKVGTHDGVAGFTVGQRKGIPGGMPEKMYVVSIDAVKNIVVIGTDKECFASDFTCRDISLVSEEKESERFKKELDIQVRYRSEAVKGKVSFRGDKGAVINLKEPVRAITPGQVAAFYDGDEVLGASMIIAVDNPHVKLEGEDR